MPTRLEISVLHNETETNITKSEIETEMNFAEGETEIPNLQFMIRYVINRDNLIFFSFPHEC